MARFGGLKKLVLAASVAVLLAAVAGCNPGTSTWKVTDEAAGGGHAREGTR